RIFQSGVLFLGYSFGLPVLVADVGSLKEDVVEGVTGSTFVPEEPPDLARAIRQYFGSDLYRNLERRRAAIQAHAAAKYSWKAVADKTQSVYAALLRSRPQAIAQPLNHRSVDQRPSVKR